MGAWHFKISDVIRQSDELRVHQSGQGVMGIRQFNGFTALFIVCIINGPLQLYHTQLNLHFIEEKGTTCGTCESLREGGREGGRSGETGGRDGIKGEGGEGENDILSKLTKQPDM
jgi:hypothetical protein